MAGRAGQTERPTRVLYVCNYNSIRSPMAAALTQRLQPGGKAESAGVYASDLDPFVIAVMREIEIDMEGFRSRALEDLGSLDFDLIVTLTPEAHHRVLVMTGEDNGKVEYWPCPDPTAAQGSRETILAAYRDLRQYLEGRIRDRL